jgi:hypothetical protein
MGTLHITEAEFARDPYAVMARVGDGMDVIVKRHHRSVAVHLRMHCIGQGERLEGDTRWCFRQGC